MARTRKLSENQRRQRADALKIELRRRARNSRLGVHDSWDGFLDSTITAIADPDSERVRKPNNFILPGEEESPLRSRPSEELSAFSPTRGRPRLPPPYFHLHHAHWHLSPYFLSLIYFLSFGTANSRAATSSWNVQFRRPLSFVPIFLPFILPPFPFSFCQV
jgi:hypothetical protein